MRPNRLTSPGAEKGAGSESRVIDQTHRPGDKRRQGKDITDSSQRFSCADQTQMKNPNIVPVRTAFGFFVSVEELKSLPYICGTQEAFAFSKPEKRRILLKKQGRRTTNNTTAETKRLRAVCFHTTRNP